MRLPVWKRSELPHWEAVEWQLLLVLLQWPKLGWHGLSHSVRKSVWHIFLFGRIRDHADIVFHSIQKKITKTTVESNSENAFRTKEAPNNQHRKNHGNLTNVEILLQNSTEYARKMYERNHMPMIQGTSQAQSEAILLHWKIRVLTQS